MTLNELWPEYATQKRLRVKLSTYSAYVNMFDKRLQPEFGSLEISDITHKRVERWAIDLNAAGLSKKTIESMIMLLNNITDYAAYAYDVPVNRVRIGKIQWINRGDEKPLRLFTRNEVEKIYKAINSEPTSVNMLMLIMLCSGMRIGEACALRLKDVDVSNHCIWVNGTMERLTLHDVDNYLDSAVRNDFEVLSKSNRSVVIISSPKTSGSRRSIPISGVVLNYLRHAKKMYNDDFFLSTMSLTALEPRTFRSIYKRLLEKSDIGRYLPPHSLRHTFATTLLTNGTDYRTVADILGHTDTSTTLNVYCHATDESKKRAISKAFNKIIK